MKLGLPRSPTVIFLLLLAVLVVVVAIFPQLFSPYDPNGIDAMALLKGPSWNHLLGTDELGSDVLTRIIYGTRLEVGITVGSVVLSILIAVPAGLIAGYRGGLIDWLFTLLADSILSFPIILFAVLIVASLGASVATLIGVLAFVFLPRIFRLVRGQTQVLHHMAFVHSARAMGVGTPAILFRHVLPNTLGPLMVIVPQLMAIAVLIEAGLSFVGLGVQPPAISWGTLLLVSKNYYIAAVWYPFSVGVVITLAAAALVLGGDIASAVVNPARRAS